MKLPIGLRVRDLAGGREGTIVPDRSWRAKLGRARPGHVFVRWDHNGGTTLADARHLGIGTPRRAPDAKGGARSGCVD